MQAPFPALESEPGCDWVYFATGAKWPEAATYDFLAAHNLIIRTIHNSVGNRIANVAQLKPGHRILLAYSAGGQPYKALASCRIVASARPVLTVHGAMTAFAELDEALSQSLDGSGYTRDPVTGHFTGICIADLCDLRHTAQQITRPSGNNTLWRWTAVFR